MAKDEFKNGLAGKVAVASVGTLAAANLVGCASEDKGSQYDDWLATDGSAGRINMEAVNAALNNSNNPTEFENRINQIYEGDNPVLVQVVDLGDGQKEVSGWEDLNGNGLLDKANDDKLFSAVVGEKGHELKGHGSNSYYAHHHSYGMGNGFFMGWMMGHMMAGGYTTPAARTQTIIRERTVYRNSPAYGTQRQANSRFTNQQKAANPQAFNRASKTQSGARSSYKASKQSSMRGSSRGGKSGGRLGGGR